MNRKGNERNMEKNYSTPYEMEGKLPLKQAIPLGLQHVLAMFVGNLTPLILITGGTACALNDSALLVTLLQNAMSVQSFRLLWEPVPGLSVYAIV